MLQRKCIQGLAKQIRSLTWQERRDRARDVRALSEISVDEIQARKHQQEKLVKLQEQEESALVKEGKWKPEKVRITHSEKLKMKFACTYKSEIPAASPGGRAISGELKKILIPQMYQQLLNEDDSTFIPCVLSLSNHPRLSFAFSRARVQPETDKLSIGFWRFSSAPRTIYALWTTSKKGILDILNNYSDGIILNRLNIIHGPLVDTQHLTEAPYVSDLSQYCYINRHCRVSPGPLLKSFKTFTADTLDEATLPTAVPPASYASEVFDWGHETEAYVAPVSARGSDGKKTDVQKNIGGFYQPGHILQTMHREPQALAEELEESRLSGSASRLYYRDPKRAAEALKMVGKQQQELIDRNSQKVITPSSSFDSI
eukprot:TRINITY_DN32117_c0_g1_i1.p1 TRINITY_DN32117_c0_g1~~TRINITY_DN32117_c0_g1_i1.p1  ORF type:complete len:372 (+),score=32.55 TRINITY_DN32117_c0_g1_i1:29-1144(+)